MENLSVIEIVWEDPTTYSEEWLDIEEARKKKATIVHSLGYMLLENEDYIIIAMDRSQDNSVHGVGVIPKRCILHTKVIG